MGKFEPRCSHKMFLIKKSEYYIALWWFFPPNHAFFEYFKFFKDSLGQVKKLDVSRPRPLPFLLPPPFFLLFTNFNTNLYIALVVVQKMYIQLSNSFGHRSSERILPYENCSYSTVTWHRPKLDQTTSGLKYETFCTQGTQFSNWGSSQNITSTIFICKTVFTCSYNMCCAYLLLL